MAFIAPLFAAGGAGTAASSVFTVGNMLQLAGTAIGAMGALQAGQAQANAANYNAALAQQTAAAEAERSRRASARQMGAIRAAIGKSGVTSEGTPLMVLADSAAEAEIDAMNAMWSGNQRSNMLRREGSMARREGYYRAGSSLLTGATRLL